MFYLCIFLSLLSVLGFHSTVRGQLNETAFTSDAQCYGDELVVNATCPLLSSIALNNIRVGTRPNANGCHGNETTGDGTGCCQSSSDACEFDFPISDSVHFYDQCNGGQLCRPGVEKIDVIHGSCNASVYPVFTNYMYFDYFCIEDSRISHMDLGHITVENAALYLQSPNYTTSNISSSVSELSCSVETRYCNAVILIYVIERNLAGVMNCTQCNQTQSLSIIEEDGSTLVNWSSKDNTYTISQPLQTAGSYILVNFTNIMTTDGGKFWIGFQASLPTNLTPECPAIEKQYCFPSTTRSTTTTSTTSRSMTTRMTTSKHSSLDTQKTGTAFPTVSSIINTTHRDNNGGNTNNILVIATSVSGGVVLLGLITAGVLFYKKKKQRPTPDKSKPTPPNLIPSTPVSKDDPKPPPTPPNRTPTTPPPPPRPNRSPTPPQTPLNRTPTPPSNRTPTPPPTPPNRTPTPPPNRTPTPLPTPPNRTPTPPLPPPNRTPTPPPTSPNRTPTPPPTPPNRTPTPLPYRTPTPPPTLPNRTPAPLPPPQNRTPTPSPTPPNRSPTPPPTTPNRTPSPPPTTPNRTPTQPLTAPNRTPTPPPTTPKRTPTPPPTTPNRTPSPPPTQLNITPSPKVPEDDPTTTPDKSKVTHIRRISSNMCRRYYKDLLKSLAEDAFLLMIYSEEKNRRRKKRRIKRNLVNPKRL